MGAAEFPEENWVREINQTIRARVMSLFLREVLPEICPKTFSTPPRVVAHSEQGWINMTLIVENAEGSKFVLRLQKAPEGKSFIETGARWSNYHKEEWAIRNVAPGVPVPEVIENGIGYTRLGNIPKIGSAEYAYSIHTYLPFPPAKTRTSSGERQAFLRRLGRMARLVNSTPAVGFGAALDYDSQQFSFASWTAFFDHKLKECALDTLVERCMISSALRARANERLFELRNRSIAPQLIHMDLLGNWGNALVDERGEIRGVIDWEFCHSGPGFQYEIASMLYVMYRDGRDRRQIASDLRAVLDGYDMSYPEYAARYKADVDTLVLVNAFTAMSKFLAIHESGGAASQPWRELFAARGKTLAEAILGQPRRRSRVAGAKRGTRRA